jgi:hypothetical protein
MTALAYDEMRRVMHTTRDGRALCGKQVHGEYEWTAVLADVAMPCGSCERAAAAMMEREAA